MSPSLRQRSKYTEVLHPQQASQPLPPSNSFPDRPLSSITHYNHFRPYITAGGLEFTFGNTYTEIRDNLSMPISAPCMKDQKVKQKCVLVCNRSDSSIGIFPAGSPLGLASRKCPMTDEYYENNVSNGPDGVLVVWSTAGPVSGGSPSVPG